MASSVKSVIILRQLRSAHVYMRSSSAVDRLVQLLASLLIPVAAQVGFAESLPSDVIAVVTVVTRVRPANSNGNSRTTAVPCSNLRHGSRLAPPTSTRADRDAPHVLAGCSERSIDDEARDLLAEGPARTGFFERDEIDDLCV